MSMDDAGSDTRIAPWLAVSDATKAVEFYKLAFDAAEAHRLDDDNGAVVVAQLQVDGATFWVQQDVEKSPDGHGGSPVRMILMVTDPGAWFARAVAAGSTAVADVHEEHGWLTGRVSDPFGYDWEFSRYRLPD
jgi:PhnB protein